MNRLKKLQDQSIAPKPKSPHPAKQPICDRDEEDQSITCWQPLKAGTHEAGILRAALIGGKAYGVPGRTKVCL